MYQNRHITRSALHILVCMPLDRSGGANQIRKTEETTMEQQNITQTQPLDRPVPWDLDDLIFQEEPWWVSDR